MSSRSLQKDTTKKTMTRQQEIKSALKELKQTMKIKKQPHYRPSQRDNNPQKHLSPEKMPKTFYTNSFRQKIEIRLSEIKDRQRELSAKSFEKQIQAKLRRKIHDNIELKQKMEMLNEIKQRKEQMLQEKELKIKKEKDQALLLHESNMKNFEMIQRMKKKAQKKQLSESKLSEQQSLHDLKFNTFMQEKKKSEKLLEIKSRQQMMFNSKSKSKHKTSMNTLMSSKNFETVTSRVMHTSKSTRERIKKSEILQDHIVSSTQSKVYCQNLKNSLKQIKSARKQLSSILQKKEEQSIDLKDMEEDKQNKNEGFANKNSKIDFIYFK